MKFKLGNGKFSMGNLVAAILFAKMIGILEFLCLQSYSGLSQNVVVFTSRMTELLIFFGLSASIYSPRVLPVYAIYKSNIQNKNKSSIGVTLMVVVVVAATSRYAIELITIAVANFFDILSPEEIKEITKVTASPVSSIISDLTSGKAISQLTVVPVVEEIVYRGVLFNYCLLNFRAGQANVISSLIFAIFHGNPIAAFLGGMIFGHIYLRTGNLIYCMVAHSVANATIIILYGFSTSLFPSLSSNTHNWIIQSALYFIAFMWLATLTIITIKQFNYSAISAFDDLRTSGKSTNGTYTC